MSVNNFKNYLQRKFLKQKSWLLAYLINDL